MVKIMHLGNFLEKLLKNFEIFLFILCSKFFISSMKKLPPPHCSPDPTIREIRDKLLSLMMPNEFGYSLQSSIFYHSDYIFKFELTEGLQE